jgi:SRSO17 transposase
MATKRKPTAPTAPTTAAIDRFCAAFDDLFARYEERIALRHYLIGLLLPREHNKTVVELAAIVPGANRQGLHHFMHDAPSRCRGAQPPPAAALEGPSGAGAACGRGAHRR